jgi:hypothetical protein
MELKCAANSMNSSHPCVYVNVPGEFDFKKALVVLSLPIRMIFLGPSIFFLAAGLMLYLSDCS